MESVLRLRYYALCCCLQASAIRWIFLIGKLEKNFMLITLFTAVFPFNFWSEHITHKPGDHLAVRAPRQCPGLWSPDLQWMWSTSEDHVLGEGQHRAHKMNGSFGDSSSLAHGRVAGHQAWVTSFTVMEFLPHDEPGIVALCPLAWVPLRRDSDHDLQQALLQCTILLARELSV